MFYFVSLLLQLARLIKIVLNEESNKTFGTCTRLIEISRSPVLNMVSVKRFGFRRITRPTWRSNLTENKAGTQQTIWLPPQALFKIEQKYSAAAYTKRR